MSNIQPPYSDTTPIAPPYNATNFNTGNSVILSTLITYANNSPNYPWDTGSDAQQIYRSRQNIVYFNTLNQQTAAQRTINGNLGYTPENSVSCCRRCNSIFNTHQKDEQFSHMLLMLKIAKKV
jgi:hypothetical protein